MNKSGHNPALIIELAAWLAAKDGMGLPRSSLTVSHNHPVESIEHVLDNWLGQLFVGKLLFTVHRKTVVEHEVALVKALADQRDLSVFHWRICLHAKVLSFLTALLDFIM